jgi:hypothetical protein
MSFKVLKADGNLEVFLPQKLKSSLLKSGASAEEVDAIVGEIESILYDGIKTQDIYTHAFKLLKNSETVVAARYSLRRALFNLGPTGFPFEDFLARLFAHEGYKTRTGVILQGHCAEHELDVVAYKADHSFVAEAKFHSQPAMKTDLQVALYSFARLDDLKNIKICPDDICKITELMIITNTKFTTAAERYCECKGVKLLSWSYPQKGNLYDKIQSTGMYPITVLQTLSQSQKMALIARGIIVCPDLVLKPQVLRHIHISQKRTESVLFEAKQLAARGI